MLFTGAVIGAIVIIALDRDPPVDVLRAEAKQSASESMLAVVNPGDELVIQVSRPSSAGPRRRGRPTHFETRISEAMGRLGADADPIIRKMLLDARPALAR